MCLLGSVHPGSTLISLGGKAKKSWDPTRVERLKEFRDNLHSRVGSRYEGSWSVGISAKNRATEAQGEKKKRKGKKERAKLKATQDEQDEEGDDGSNTGVQPEIVGKSQKRKRADPDISSHSHEPLPGEAEGHVEEGARKKRRRQRHKKGSGGGGKTDAVAVS